jgi:hypothetical protein
MTENDDLLIFSEAHLHAQLETAPYTLGFYTVHFYTHNALPAGEATDTVAEFYLYPSGGTLRDAAFNIVFYDSQYDTYRGFIPPHTRTAH